MRADISAAGVVGVLGAGAMGRGIAQVAAANGHRVIVADASSEAVAAAKDGIRKALARDVEKRRITAEASAACLERLTFVEVGSEAPPHAFGGCAIVIEAIAERLDQKQRAFLELEEVVDESCVLATNTSSLSIAAIAARCLHPERVVGVHFFNPAPVMPLVEIVPGLATAQGIRERTQALIDAWGKVTILSADTPGFVVNRVARPFYGESIRLLEEGVAGIATIDWAMRELGGFRMGPFELMDFIGHDVNFTVTQSVFEGLFYDPRYRPSVTQQRLVDAGFLGRKSGRGFYDYRDGATNPSPVSDRALGKRIVRRVLAMLVNEAVDAVFMHLASVRDIELAMTKGVNYPKGLLAWGEEIGLSRILDELDGRQAEFGDDRYRPSPLLRRMVRERRSFFA